MPDLPKRTLGRTGLEVTTLGYGAMELRGAPRGRDVSDEQADRILNAALDSGINFVDTSIDYGLAEERIGKYISHRRSEYYLATKAGCLSGPLLDNPPEPVRPNGGFPHVFTPENIIRGIDQSLSRMKTDYVDILQFHSSPSMAHLKETGALDCVLDLKKQGKVRFIGMSGTVPNLADHIASGFFDEFQIPYSALQRDHEDLMSDATKAGAGIVIRGGAAKGGPGKEEGDFWATWQRVGLDDLIGGEMERMEFILRFTYTNPNLDTTIVGTINPDHLQHNIDALLKGPLPDDLYQEAKRRLAQAGFGADPHANAMTHDHDEHEGHDHEGHDHGDHEGHFHEIEPRHFFGVVPVLLVDDVLATVEFYRDTLGFEPDFMFEDPPTYASVSREDAIINFSLSQPPGRRNSVASAGPGSGTDLYIVVKDVDDIYTEFKLSGVSILLEPDDTSYGMREFKIEDINGYQIILGEEIDDEDDDA